NVSQMTFIGDVISEQGVQPDPKKVAAILNMERPQNKQDVQRFLGMINYQGKFIPDLYKVSPRRSRLEKTNEWMWQDAQEEAWCQLKEALTQDPDPCLHFYDSTKPTKLSVDASKNGDRMLLQQHDQNWFPIAYASRAMTDAETRYAQIEKELLAMRSACERFHQYVHGRQVEVK
uniref:POL protein n=1 Tax=Strongylocentrotus purpuratus TaxID=7668 RepID=Q9TX36_STRPU|nr:pol gene product {Gypsy/Ty3-class retrotransposon Spr4} [Strongylocentrotus purpuratus=sea urchins, testis, sperm, Peptide Transposon, 174 aa] [Strongylocentrotus purpuratus]